MKYNHIERGDRKMRLKSMLFFAIMMTLAFILVACSDNNSNGNGEKDDAAADKFPEKPIDVVVAYKAGGGTDVGARILTNAAEEVSDYSFVVQNRDGAGGELGYNYLANSNPDGYTIGFIN